MSDGETFDTRSRVPIVGLKAPTTLLEARELLSSLTVRYLSGEISEHVLRAATYATGCLQKVLAAEKSQELERRIRALEDAK